MALHRSVGREQRALAIELNIHIVLLWTGQARFALDRQQHELQRVLDSGSSKMLAMLMVRRADSELHLGNVAAATLTTDRALQALRATDMIGAELASTARSIADVRRRCGHWDSGLSIVDESQQRLGSQRDPEQLLAWALAEIYLDLGRPDLAHRHIEAFAAVSQHSARQGQRALALRWRFALAVGARIDAAAVVADVLNSENLLQACKLVLVAGQAGEPELTPAQCMALIARCEPHALREELAPLHALCAWLLARGGDAPAALSSVNLAALELQKGDIGTTTPLCRLWLARALLCAGRADEAAQQARSATAWLAERAQHSVPPEFRESFLRRNPVHAELMSWSAA